MLPAFAEAIRATTQPCTMLLILPALVTVLITRGRWAPFAAICIGAVVGGWLYIANVVALSDAQLQLSGLLVAMAIAIVVAAPATSWLSWAAKSTVQTTTAGMITFVATLWWRPCVGVELGSILSGARQGLWGQFPGMCLYMLGALVPVLAVVLAIRAIDPSQVAGRRAAWVAGVVGFVVAGALAVGRHDELVVTLTRWTTS